MAQRGKNMKSGLEAWKPEILIFFPCMRLSCFPSPSPPRLGTFAVAAVFICRHCCCFKRSIFTWNVIQLAEQCVGLNKHLGGSGSRETRWRLALAGRALLAVENERSFNFRVAQANVSLLLLTFAQYQAKGESDVDA